MSYLATARSQRSVKAVTLLLFLGNSALADYDGLGAIYALAHVDGIDENTLIGAVCTDCGRVLGKALHSRDLPGSESSAVFLTGLEVARDAVRIGIGSAMLQFFKDRGASKTWWHVSIDNTPALAMSRRVGATEHLDGSSITFTLTL